MYDINISLSGDLGGAAVDVWTTLLLHVVPEPKEDTTVVQVDYEHRMLLVNRTKPLSIQGYYDASVDHAGPGTRYNVSDLETQAELGYTSVMFYGFFNQSAAEQQRVLDELAARGM